MSSREQYVQVIKSAAHSIIKNNLKTVIINKLLSWLPSALLTAVNPIVGFIATILADELVEQSELFAFFLFTDFRTTKQGQKTYADMEYNYKMQISGTKAQKEVAEINLMASSRTLIALAA